MTHAMAVKRRLTLKAHHRIFSLMDLNQVLNILEQNCRKAGSRLAWAKAHEVSPSYVNTVFSGRREPGKKILDALGITKRVEYHFNKRQT